MTKKKIPTGASVRVKPTGLPERTGHCVSSKKINGKIHFEVQFPDQEDTEHHLSRYVKKIAPSGCDFVV